MNKAEQIEMIVEMVAMGYRRGNNELLRKAMLLAQRDLTVDEVADITIRACERAQEGDDKDD